jgi:hypothetical protein
MIQKCICFVEHLLVAILCSRELIRLNRVVNGYLKTVIRTASCSLRLAATMFVHNRRQWIYTTCWTSILMHLTNHNNVFSWSAINNSYCFVLSNNLRPLTSSSSFSSTKARWKTKTRPSSISLLRRSWPSHLNHISMIMSAIKVFTTVTSYKLHKLTSHESS